MNVADALTHDAEAPRPGYYRKRAPGRGPPRTRPWAAVRIWEDGDAPDTGDPGTALDAIERRPRLRAEMNGIEVPVEAVWPYVQPIDRATYLRLLREPNQHTILRKEVP